MSQAKAKRSIAKKEIQAVPDNSVVLSAGESVTGTFGGISIFEADFPNEVTSIKINGVGVNLSALNGKVPDGWTYVSHFTKVSVPEGSGMVLVVYGF